MINEQCKTKQFWICLPGAALINVFRLLLHFNLNMDKFPVLSERDLILRRKAYRNRHVSFSLECLINFDPDYNYLENGSVYISYNGNGKASLWGESIATHRLDKVGVQLVLQRCKKKR